MYYKTKFGVKTCQTCSLCAADGVAAGWSMAGRAGEKVRLGLSGVILMDGGTGWGRPSTIVEKCGTECGTERDNPSLL